MAGGDEVRRSGPDVVASGRHREAAEWGSHAKRVQRSGPQRGPPVPARDPYAGAALAPGTLYAGRGFVGGCSARAKPATAMHATPAGMKAQAQALESPMIPPSTGPSTPPTP